jgi:hypothetical protein
MIRSWECWQKYESLSNGCETEDEYCEDTEAVTDNRNVNIDW